MYKDRLVELRENNNLKQKDIAEIISITRGAYSHYETEDDLLPIKSINLISNYFDVSLDYIFNFNNTKKYKNNNKDLDLALFKERLKSFRKEQHLTQNKLANELHTVQQVISNYEKGKHIIATPFLYTICKKYNISADYLLGKIDSPKYLK